MRAIVLQRTAPIEEQPLVQTELPTPTPESNEILVKVSVCGLCHSQDNAHPGTGLRAVPLGRERDQERRQCDAV